MSSFLHIVLFTPFIELSSEVCIAIIDILFFIDLWITLSTYVLVVTLFISLKIIGWKLIIRLHFDFIASSITDSVESRVTNIPLTFWL